MKIGLVLAATPSYSETFFNSKIRGLIKEGHEVILYTRKSDATFDVCAIKEPYPIYQRNFIKQFFLGMMVCLKLCGSFKTLIRFAQLERKDQVPLKKILKNAYNSAHLLTQNLDWLHFGFATLALGKENVAQAIRAKMGVSIRGFDMAIYPVKYPNCYDGLWEKIDKLHTISDDLYQLALQQGLSVQTPVQKITPAIDVSLFQTTIEKKVVQQEPLQLITVARLHWKKGLTDTLMALKILKESGVLFQYSIVGEGPEYEKLMYLRYQLDLEKEVTFVGKVPHENIKELLLQNEVYIQYSISEGFCNSVLEAQALGLLCVVSDAEGLSENVMHGKSGWVVPKRSPELLAQKIQEVISLEEIERGQIRAFAVHRVQQEFNIEKQQQEFINFYS